MCDADTGGDAPIVRIGLPGLLQISHSLLWALDLKELSGRVKLRFGVIRIGFGPIENRADFGLLACHSIGYLSDVTIERRALLNAVLAVGDFEPADQPQQQADNNH